MKPQNKRIIWKDSFVLLKHLSSFCLICHTGIFRKARQHLNLLVWDKYRQIVFKLCPKLHTYLEYSSFSIVFPKSLTAYWQIASANQCLIKTSFPEDAAVYFILIKTCHVSSAPLCQLSTGSSHPAPARTTYRLKCSQSPTTGRTTRLRAAGGRWRRCLAAILWYRYVINTGLWLLSQNIRIHCTHSTVHTRGKVSLVCLHSAIT